MSLMFAESLQTLVKNKYSTAKAAGALTFASSHLSVLDVGGASFQLRYCPGLAKKPTGKDNGQPLKPRGPKIDPFDNPSQDLLVTEVPLQNPTHIIVLNKFPIIENHFILATKHNKQQTQRLEEDDLLRTYQCLESWPDGQTGRGRLFAFFNSGEHSGASQPHRHLQLLPVEDMEAGLNGRSWELLVDKIMAGSDVKLGSTKMFKTLPALPFTHFGAPIPPHPSAQLLHSIYTTLYTASLSAASNHAKGHGSEFELQSTEDENLPISYNLAMTTECMVMCPRRSEGLEIKRQDGSVIDTVALNGTVLGGTLMVKNEELFEVLKGDSGKLIEVLTSIGIPITSSKL